MISFVIPAHNEQAMIGRTVDSIRRAADAVGRPYEIIVVDDDSSDDTAAIARQLGARVESVKLRQIAAVRNAGARVACGRWLIFVDADTMIDRALLQRACDALDDGVVGGGALVAMDGPTNWVGRGGLALWNGWTRITQEAAGCFIFCRADDFSAVGGFDEQWFAAEELHLSSRALKQRGRFVILGSPAVTSNRKARLYGPIELIVNMFRLLWRYPHRLHSRDALGLWYESRRDEG